MKEKKIIELILFVFLLRVSFKKPIHIYHIWIITYYDLRIKQALVDY